MIAWLTLASFGCSGSKNSEEALNKTPSLSYNNLYGIKFEPLDICIDINFLNKNAASYYGTLYDLIKINNNGKIQKIIEIEDLIRKFNKTKNDASSEYNFKKSILEHFNKNPNEKELKTTGPFPTIYIRNSINDYQTELDTKKNEIAEAEKEFNTQMQMLERYSIKYAYIEQKLLENMNHDAHKRGDLSFYKNLNEHLHETEKNSGNKLTSNCIESIKHVNDIFNSLLEQGEYHLTPEYLLLKQENSPNIYNGFDYELANILIKNPIFIKKYKEKYEEADATNTPQKLYGYSRPLLEELKSQLSEFKQMLATGYFVIRIQEK